MKKTIILLAVAINSLCVTAQENNSWRFGVQSGFQGNASKYVGGMDGANARFHQSPFGAGAFGLVARYDINNHWFLTTGIGNAITGFEFALAENYSFVGNSKHFSEIKSNSMNFEIPLMASYKFNPNCKNWRWFVSGGIANVFVNEQHSSEGSAQGNDGPSSSNYISADINSVKGNNLQARWAVGREKMFKTGSILSFSLLFNYGFSEVSHATVNYTVDGTTYQHEFSNKGTYLGFRVAYFFRPLNTLRTNKAKSRNNNSAPLAN